MKIGFWSSIFIWSTVFAIAGDSSFITHLSTFGMGASAVILADEARHYWEVSPDA